MFKKTTFAQRTVKKASKWAKKNPKTAVAVGGGLIATTIGGIASSLTFGLKVRKLQNMVPQPQPAPEQQNQNPASSQQGDQKPIDVDDDEVTEPNESKDENEETEQETDETNDTEEDTTEETPMESNENTKGQKNKSRKKRRK